MSGICGIFQQNDEAVSLPLIRSMTETIKHRGLDDTGYYADGQIALGHRHLAISGTTSEGHQLMADKTGDLIIVYDGVLFNHSLLRDELIHLGYQFVSKTDTEVIICAYREWGSDCLARLNGQFAFAIWHVTQKTLFLARDHFGIKPLYYYRSSRTFIFGSEIRAILAHPDVRKTISLSALNEYFTFQNMLSDLTLFQGIQQLPSGHHLTISASSNTAVPICYWDFPIADEQLNISEAEAVEEIYRLFTQAVSRQLLSDGSIVMGKRFRIGMI